jgi:hypothetical protein
MESVLQMYEDEILEWEPTRTVHLDSAVETDSDLVQEPAGQKLVEVLKKILVEDDWQRLVRSSGRKPFPALSCCISVGTKGLLRKADPGQCKLTLRSGKPTVHGKQIQNVCGVSATRSPKS